MLSFFAFMTYIYIYISDLLRVKKEQWSNILTNFAFILISMCKYDSILKKKIDKLLLFIS